MHVFNYADWMGSWLNMCLMPIEEPLLEIDFGE